MSALSVHQSSTLPQKIDSREGWFWCKKGVSLRMWQNEFIYPKTAIYTLFWAICSKIQCVLLLNAVRFGAKRKIK